MTTKDWKYRAVTDSPDYEQDPAQGEWEIVVHDCRLPSLSEIEAKQAAVGTVWKCGGDNGCGDRWKLITHTAQGTLARMNGQSELQWIRITPKTDTPENGE